MGHDHILVLLVVHDHPLCLLVVVVVLLLVGKLLGICSAGSTATLIVTSDDHTLTAVLINLHQRLGESTQPAGW